MSKVKTIVVEVQTIWNDGMLISSEVSIFCRKLWGELKKKRQLIKTVISCIRWQNKWLFGGTWLIVLLVKTDPCSQDFHSALGKMNFISRKFAFQFEKYFHTLRWPNTFQRAQLYLFTSKVTNISFCYNYKAVSHTQNEKIGTHWDERS